MLLLKLKRLKDFILAPMHSLQLLGRQQNELIEITRKITKMQRQMGLQLEHQGTLLEKGQMQFKMASK